MGEIVFPSDTSPSVGVRSYMNSSLPKLREKLEAIMALPVRGVTSLTFSNGSIYSTSMGISYMANENLKLV